MDADPGLPDALAEGHEPNENAGPDEAGSSPLQCEHRAGELDAPVHQAQFSVIDELSEPYVSEPAVMVAHPVDGLPVPAQERVDLPLAHPFRYETMVCVGDDRVYVELWSEEIIARNRWSRSVNGKVITVGRSAWSSSGEARTRRVFARAQVVRRWDEPVVVMARGALLPEEDGVVPSQTMSGRSAAAELACVREGVELLLPVRPTREPCDYYKRQLFANDDVTDPAEPGHYIVFRNCGARRSVGGALLSPSNEAIYACDYRNPPAPESG